MRIYIHVMRPDFLDLALVAFAACVGVIEIVRIPKLKRALAHGSTTARPRFYGVIIAAEWLFTGVIGAIWIANGRPWSALLLGTLSWRVAIGFALVPVSIAISLQNQRMLQTASPQRIARLHARVVPLEFFLPHTVQEHRLFQVLSVTAGICEEFLYRGFIMWALAYYVGLPAAVVLQAVTFSLGHIYQGNDARSVAQALLKTGAAGLILGAIAVASGSLIPGMIVHALMDLSSGDVAFALLSRVRGSATV